MPLSSVSIIFSRLPPPSAAAASRHQQTPNAPRGDYWRPPHINNRPDRVEATGNPDVMFNGFSSARLSSSSSSSVKRRWKNNDDDNNNNNKGPIGLLNL